MSHPNHELSPSEHQLSQDVLEFLIAHQDWFMLDTPPPPAYPPTPSRSLTPPITPYDAASASARTSVSDGEGPDGWRIIQRHQRTGTADDHRSRQHRSATAQQQQQGQQQGQSSSAAGGIVRSRTMLMSTSRKGRPATAPATADGPSGSATVGAKQGAGGMSTTVLRKTRRVSVQPGS